MKLSGLAAIGLFMSAAAFAQQQGPQHMHVLKTDADRIRNALSAAPRSVTKDATLMTMDGDNTRVLRQGKGEFTCFADDPTSPGNDPMCLDKNAMEWFHALMERKEPPKGKIGLVYMLQGGSDASNEDPWATKPDSGKWIETGPHIMVTGATEMLSAYPKTAADPTKPYIMWPNTPYAHIMMPVR
jgi:hypothetical protein